MLVLLPKRLHGVTDCHTHTHTHIHPSTRHPSAQYTLPPDLTHLTDYHHATMSCSSRQSSGHTVSRISFVCAVCTSSTSHRKREPYVLPYKPKKPSIPLPLRAFTSTSSYCTNCKSPSRDLGALCSMGRSPSLPLPLPRSFIWRERETARRNKHPHPLCRYIPDHSPPQRRTGSHRCRPGVLGSPLLAAVAAGALLDRPPSVE